MNIAYWSTACLEPRIEAVSQEVLQLAEAFPRSWVFSVNPHLGVRWSLRQRLFGVSPRLSVLMRLVAPVCERAFRLSHVYGDMTPWVYHKALGSRPVIHTVTQDSGSPVLEFLERSAAVVVQSDATFERLLSLGVQREKLHLKLPAMDLTRFQPGLEPRRSPTRILFATAPRTVEEMAGRGVHLLLAAAKLLPEVVFRLLYRTWATGYTSLEPTRAGIVASELKNVELTDTVTEDMSTEYRACDFTIIPFTQRAGGKECPNSALESLACGVPVLVSRACPFSRFVAENDCGVVFDPTPQALVHAISVGRERWRELSRRARLAAEKHFDVRQLVEFYRGLYERHAAS